MFQPRNKPQPSEPAPQKRRRVKHQAGEAEKPKEPDEAWIDSAKKLAKADAEAGRNPLSKIIIGALLLFGAAGVIKLVASHGKDTAVAEPSPVDYYASPKAIREIARSFAYNTDPGHRLSLSRHPETTARHMPSYLPSARDGMVENLRSLGQKTGADPPRSGFAATMEDGKQRLLVVVESDAELRVDWDTFARHCTVPWADLFSGEAQQSDARVFAERDNYHPEPFDESHWISLSLYNPDADGTMYGFVRRGSPDADRLWAITEKAPPIGSRVIMRLSRKGGSEGLHFFEIEELLHDDWIVP